MSLKDEVLEKNVVLSFFLAVLTDVNQPLIGVFNSFWDVRLGRQNFTFRQFKQMQTCESCDCESEEGFHAQAITIHTAR